MSDEFYVGYVPRAPRRMAAWIRGVVLSVLAGTAALAIALALAQNPFAAATFEFGETHTFSGILRDSPFPSLELEGGRLVWLVAPGKHGASGLVRGHDGRHVDLTGTRIQRDGDRMIEVTPGSVRTMDAQDASPLQWVRSADVELRGEIVDSKCYLGVMNPGEGKVHRDCAARCISGGIPPALIARDVSGRRKLFLLTGVGGRAINRELLPYAGEPVVLRGTLFHSGEQYRIEADPNQIRRLE